MISYHKFNVTFFFLFILIEKHLVRKYAQNFIVTFIIDYDQLS